MVVYIPSMLKPSKCLPDSLQDSVEEMKNCYEGTPILHKKLLNNLVSQYLNFTQKHVTYTSKDLPIWSKHPCHLFLIKKNTCQESGWGGVGSNCPIKLRKKRQCTIHLTVFSDGKKTFPAYHLSRVRLRINAAGKKEWDRRVKVAFQPKA